mgnify:CR=1 FL=1
MVMASWHSSLLGGLWISLGLIAQSGTEIDKLNLVQRTTDDSDLRMDFSSA